MANDYEKYLKARKDLIDALHSFNDLHPLQKEQLTKELFGAGAVVAIQDIVRRYFGGTTNGTK